MTSTSAGPVRVPRQARSQKSWDRAVHAVIRLLAERGDVSFTLAEVAERSGVSIGSMYARIASKDDLLRVTHARLMERLTEEAAVAFEVTVGDPPLLPDVVDLAVRRMADLLEKHAPTLAPFMTLARTDDIIKAQGRTAHETVATAYEALVLQGRAGIRHADPVAAVAWTGTLVYAVLARELGLGSDPGVSREHDWAELLDRLTATVTAYLRGD